MRTVVCAKATRSLSRILNNIFSHSHFFLHTYIPSLLPSYAYSKAKLFDVDPDVDMDSSAPTMTATVRWRKPTPLPLDPKNPPIQVDSKEYASQTARMASVPAVSYLSDADVPSNPNPLTDIEQALEFTTQASATAPESIPWVPPPPQPQVPPAATMLDQVGGGFPAAASTGASIETVQALGLPLFLTGQNVQALQTLASTPSLLQTFVDPSGTYDQTRLLQLVQTLSQNLAPSQPGPRQERFQAFKFRQHLPCPLIME